MKRCTQWGVEHASVVDNHVNYIDRLAEYEDTGLSPEEIAALQKYHDFYTSDDACDSRLLIELAVAYKEGRIVMKLSNDDTN